MLYTENLILRKAHYKKPQIYEETGICIASKYQGNG